MKLTSVEVCAGGGGQALGIELAEFEHLILVEREKAFCETLKLNRKLWNVRTEDLKKFDARSFKGVDLFAGGLPCPPFSIAGKQLGKADERNLFPAALDRIDECRPRAVMIENVRGILNPVFDGYRKHIKRELTKLGYVADWRLLNASDFGVPQLRPRFVFVAIRKRFASHFEWPTPRLVQPKTVGETLYPLMVSRGWRGAQRWRDRANAIAPTIVGGSLKHGGPDLGPTRAKRAWAELGVNAMKLADEAPASDFVGMPCLMVEMVALLQGFPPEWRFAGRKTVAYRQVGNAFPPPVAREVALQIAACLSRRRSVAVAG